MTNIIQVWSTNWVGVIGTITPAFKEYALSLMLAQANFFHAALDLELPTPITTNVVTKIMGSPRTNGITGGIVLNNRYAWNIADGKVEAFVDFDYYSRTLADEEECQRLITMSDLLSTNAAVTLASNALVKLGFDLAMLEQKTPEAKQFVYDDGKEAHLLPLYRIDWGNVRVEVSGVTSNMVRLFNVSPALQIPIPTNYFEMIGATNRFAPQPGADGETLKLQTQD